MFALDCCNSKHGQFWDTAHNWQLVTCYAVAGCICNFMQFCSDNNPTSSITLHNGLLECQTDSNKWHHTSFQKSRWWFTKLNSTVSFDFSPIILVFCPCRLSPEKRCQINASNRNLLTFLGPYTKFNLAGRLLNLDPRLLMTGYIYGTMDPLVSALSNWVHISNNMDVSDIVGNACKTATCTNNTTYHCIFPLTLPSVLLNPRKKSRISSRRMMPSWRCFRIVHGPMISIKSKSRGSWKSLANILIWMNFFTCLQAHAFA